MIKYVANFNIAKCPKREIKVLTIKTHCTVIVSDIIELSMSVMVLVTLNVRRLCE